MPFLSAWRPAVHSTRPRTMPQGAHGRPAPRTKTEENGICPGAVRQGRDEPGRGPNASNRLRSWNYLGWNLQKWRSPRRKFAVFRARIGIKEIPHP